LLVTTIVIQFCDLAEVYSTTYVPPEMPPSSHEIEIVSLETITVTLKMIPKRSSVILMLIVDWVAPEFCPL
jgi:hypothetical protein